MIDPNRYSAYVFDLDGVVWLHDAPIPGVAAAIAALREIDKQVRFLTNNASRHRRHYAEKLNGMGIAAEIDEVVSAGFAAARYIANVYGPSRIHVMGTADLAQEMSEAGHTVVDEPADIVVGGFDHHFSWDKLHAAFRNIELHGARFIACNDDRRYPTPTGNQPGTGANIAALAYAVGCQPEVVVGKPNQPILDVLFSTLSVEPAACLMLGDKLRQDVGVGRRAGMATAFVLSGCDSQDDLAASDIRPDYVLSSAAELLAKLR